MLKHQEGAEPCWDSRCLLEPTRSGAFTAKVPALAPRALATLRCCLLLCGRGGSTQQVGDLPQDTKQIEVRRLIPAQNVLALPVTSFVLQGVSPPSHPCRCFKVKPESCAVPAVGRRQLVSELLQAGSFWKYINSTKAPFKPSIHYCCFQEHTQFTIWPGILYAPSWMESNIAPLFSGRLLLLSPGPGLCRAPLPPARCCWPRGPVHGSWCKIGSIWDTPSA